jgi:hypothetical protein
MDYAPFDGSVASTVATFEPTMPCRFLPNIRKKDFVANFWQGLPNFDTIDLDLEKINVELKKCITDIEILSDYDYLMNVSNKVKKDIENLNKLILERTEGRDSFSKMIDVILKELNNLNNFPALLTTDKCDIDTNKEIENNANVFANKLINYKQN